MIKLLKTSKWVIAFMSITALLFVTSCGDDGGDPEPEPIVPPTAFTYPATSVAVGAEGTADPSAVTGDEPVFSIVDAGDAAAFVSVDASTGVISVAAESTTGSYTVEVKATNSAGSANGTAEITIGINPDFDPTGKELLWKYFMNNTEGVTLLNLNLLDENAPASVVLPVGWPAGWPTAIDPTDPTFPTYFFFTGVQEALMQVPGDDACGEVEKDGDKSVYQGDTLLVIVNPDLTLSTKCRKKSDKNTTVTTEIGTSAISYANDGFVWTIDVALKGVPVSIIIEDVAIVSDYIDPLLPNWSDPSGNGGMYDAITGNVENYMTPTDFNPANYLASIEFLNVDVVLQILE